MRRAPHRLAASLALLGFLLPLAAHAETDSAAAGLLAQAHLRPLGQLEDVQSRSVVLSDGRTLVTVSARDTWTGELLTETFHEGRPIDAARAAAEADAAWRARHGVLAAPLVARIGQAAADDLLDAGLWYAAEVPEEQSLLAASDDFAEDAVEGSTDSPAVPLLAEPAPRRAVPSTAEIEAHMLARGQEVRAAIAGPRADLLARLADADVEVLHACSITPSIVVRATPATLQRLARWPELGRIDDAPREGGPELNIGSPTSNAAPLTTDGLVDYSGTGTTVAVVEGGQVYPDNPHMEVHDTFAPSRQNWGDRGHATAVAGIIASRHPTHRGVAPYVRLLSANSVDTNPPPGAAIEDAIDWAVDEGAHILNLSWGRRDQDTPEFTYLDRKLDWIARYMNRLVVVSAGNQGAVDPQCEPTSAPRGTASPGRGFNVLTVGAYDDKNSRTWGDDHAWACSNFLPFPKGDNPLSGVHRKPDIDAPGVLIRSLGVPGLAPPLSDDYPLSRDMSGTSFAAPFVTGVAALLMQANQSLRGVAPTMVRAALTVGTPSTRSNSPALNGTAALHVLEEGHFHWKNATSAADFPMEYTVQLHEGQQVRSRITWTSNLAGNANGQAQNDMLPANLDLEVYRENGSLLTFSYGMDNPTELVTFTAPATETYTFRAVLTGSWNATGSTQYAWATYVSPRLLDRGSWRGYNRPPTRLGDFFEIRPQIAYATRPNQWRGVVLRQPATANFALEAWDGSWFDEPSAGNTTQVGRTMLRASEAGLGSLNFLMIDGNRWDPAAPHHLRVGRRGGTGTFSIQAADTIRVPANTSGRLGPYTMHANGGLFVVDLAFPPNARRTVTLEPSTGAASSNMALALYASTPSVPTSYIQSRIQHIALADSGGPGAGETLTYTHGFGTPASHGLAVYNHTNGTSPSFYLHFTAPEALDTIFANGFE